MGFLKDAKSDIAAKAAARALEEGRHVFVYRINPGMLDAGASGPVQAFAEQIEAVESTGWQLTQMAFTGDEKKATGFFLFRR